MCKGCHGISFIEMKMLYVYITLTFIIANYSADGMASECISVDELTWI